MREVLWWQTMRLLDRQMPGGSVGVGEHVRLVMDAPYQHAMMDQIIHRSPAGGADAWRVWLETERGRFPVDAPEFHARIGVMIRHRGLLANLSLRENLLLPFLYHGDGERISKAEQEVETVAAFLGLTEMLEEQAGERSGYMHALVSLGRCMLLQPVIIVAQEIHVGMSPEHLDQFRDLAIAALAKLGSGLLYLTSTEQEGSGVNFDRTLTPAPPALAA